VAVSELTKAHKKQSVQNGGTSASGLGMFFKLSAVSVALSDAANGNVDYVEEDHNNRLCFSNLLISIICKGKDNDLFG